MIERARADTIPSVWRVDAIAESLRHPLLGLIDDRLVLEQVLAPLIDDNRNESAARAVLRARRRCVAVRAVTTAHSEPAPF